MPRQARAKSETGIYHVMLRGVNHQQIFEDSEDCNKFLQTLQDCKKISAFRLFAYCLMDNHIHLLLQQGKEPIEQIIKRIGARYVYWYNAKYQRIGHLFQDRFRSEPVETEKYFLTVIRYIHQNPLKAGYCKTLEDYRFSSYLEYLSEPKVTDTAFVLKIISLQEFVRYHQEIRQDICLEIDQQRRRQLTDEQAKDIVTQLTHCKTITEVQKLDIKTKSIFVKQLKAKGLSIRQISRLTGISKGMVENYLKN